MGYLFDAATLAEVLRSVPSRALVRRLTSTATRDRWTSVITVSQLLCAARQAGHPRLMQNVIRLVAAVRVAPLDVLSAQAFAKFRATVSRSGDPDDAMIAAIAVTNDHTLVTRRPLEFQAFPNLRVEDWTAG